MKTIVLLTNLPAEANNTAGYIIGAIVALLIFGYLFYTFVKPEKF